uniref:Uncharacterized protein n=1 Tax=Sparus aurata TaxID=8175 RepID=A0A671XCJ7_SPAAU
SFTLKTHSFALKHFLVSISLALCDGERSDGSSVDDNCVMVLKTDYYTEHCYVHCTELGALTS